MTGAEFDRMVEDALRRAEASRAVAEGKTAEARALRVAQTVNAVFFVLMLIIMIGALVFEANPFSIVGSALVAAGTGMQAFRPRLVAMVPALLIWAGAAVSLGVVAAMLLRGVL